ncbi:hypothetical protein SAMN02746041_01023 [Desulfacinum hydrothermale DSM 13146]|uniref:Uncharacterized protein n=1 Tax=Desulfacinum hydrothermale DSM 13146 TaxID=1121390 RepID=A0A1W1XAL6_9BACT|nr:hypothetical protein [Desulfacinum hydrothermale]SMC20824.1 hypothetical protein SAMN02746041_01023 [Desulfacinum hydrothermale DSM 13146]
MKEKTTPLLQETMDHFQRIARENRFAENAAVPHDRDRCLVCRPEKASGDPFMVYVEVVARSIPERRPTLDEDLVAAVNEDLALYGHRQTITLKDLEEGSEEALKAWRLWVRNALDTGLELLSIHSPTSREFSLDDAQGDPARERFVEDRIQFITNAILGRKER